MSQSRAILSLASVATFATGALSCAGGPRLVEANDNRVPTGATRDGVRQVRLEAVMARWLPDDGADSTLTVQAFAARNGVPRIPGPLIRVAQGDSVRVTIVNTFADSTLVVRGIPAGSVDSIAVAPGATRTLDFAATTPGTFTYWGTTTGESFGERSGPDAQLTGAFIVDPAGAAPDPDERIFVITMMDVLPDTTKPPEGQNDIFDLAINGKSWPHSERLEYAVGDTVRWRWINGGELSHPMHLHGFHFRLTAKGNGTTEHVEAAAAAPWAVTELMRPRSTMRLEFVPTREGNWLFHCHMADHMSPFPERPDSVRAHGLHDAESHPMTTMSGLVLGVRVRPRDSMRGTEAATDAVAETDADAPAPARALRLLAQQAKPDSGRRPARGFVLQRGAEPRADSVELPGSPLILTRGERVGITVVNRLSEPTSVHWHGMELESYFDGVSGWSGTGADSRRAPLVAPGDSFAVTFTPPRAGTYIYHTHMEEEPQLTYGLFGPMIVLEPGDRFDERTDLVFIAGESRSDPSPLPTLNGRRTFEPRMLRVGTTYRLRFINILASLPLDISLRADTTLFSWRAHAKDGADLPESRRVELPSQLIFGVGETYDFLWTPRRAVDAVLVVKSAGGEPGEIRMPIRVR